MLGGMQTGTRVMVTGGASPLTLAPIWLGRRYRRRPVRAPIVVTCLSHDRRHQDVLRRADRGELRVESPLHEMLGRDDDAAVLDEHRAPSCRRP